MNKWKLNCSRMYKTINKYKYEIVVLLAISILWTIVVLKTNVNKEYFDGTQKQIVVLSKYNEDIEWTKHIKTPYIIYSKKVGEDNYISISPDSEASTYLYYIIHNYDNLYEWTLFAHAHETHWHHSKSLLDTLNIDLQRIETVYPGLEYFSVNHRQDGKIMVYEEDRTMPSEVTNEDYQQVFKDVFGEQEYNEVCKKYFKRRKISKMKYPACAQFYVHRNRIKQRSKRFYENCMHILNDDKHLLSRKASGEYSQRRIGGFFFEAVWHYIFGESLLYEPRVMNYDDYPQKIREGA